MPQTPFAMDDISILPPDSLPLQIACVFQFRYNTLDCTLGDANGKGDFPKRLFPVPCQTNQDMRVICEEIPMREL